MATNLAGKAKEAFINDDFDLAVDLYNQGIIMNPKCADLYADRAQANIKLKNFAKAISDANKAIELNPSMAKAYLRKGVAWLKLKEYQNAKATLELGASLAQNNSRFRKLIKQCDKHNAEKNGHLEEANQMNDESHLRKDLALVKPKYRHSFYQTQEEVVVTIFAKGIPPKSVAIHFEEQILSVSIDALGGEMYHLQPGLFGKIKADKCRYQVLPTKIEIYLVKAEPMNWSSLEASVLQDINLTSGVGFKKPAYPSCRPKVVDWDQLEAQVKEEEAKEEKVDVDGAMKKGLGHIYRKSNEDVRRAMIKSFVESNGTQLSTSWKEVGSIKVESRPPRGMELKKWEF